MYVIGTAGHVDHGKSLLVEALTGIDPDRLREEKTRGMTIDLGFAWLSLPGGASVSIVDVPGHERFIKNMLAGAGGIDLALFVVAADDSVMPQTLEHLAILDLLGVSRGVVAITKRDLVDGEWLALVESDVREMLRGSALEGAPIVLCSSVTREGLDELVREIEVAVEVLPPKRDVARPRLPIDRVFTIAGFGTVVTGTLIDGELAVGDELEAVPGGRRGRIRGLQSHRDTVERALPGTRTAVNLTGIAKEHLRRGIVLARPGEIRGSRAVDVRLRAVHALRLPLRHNLAVTFHSGADEANGQVRLLDADELPAGATAWAQVMLDSPVAVLRGDRFVIRTANDTVGGGVIADVAARRHRRRDPKVLATLEAMLSDAPEDRVVDLVQRRPLIDAAAIATQLGLPPAVVDPLVEAMVGGGVLNSVGARGGLVAAAYVRDVAARARALAAAYHRDHALKPGMPTEEFRSRLALDDQMFSALMPLLDGVHVAGAAVALDEFAPALSESEQRVVDEYLTALGESAENPTSGIAIDAALLAFLIDTDVVVSVGGGIVYGKPALDGMIARIRAHIEAHRTITLAETRDMFGTSRKYAQALLEFLDRSRITRRVGDERVLR